MKKNQALNAPILTPSTKAEKGDHDKSARARTNARDGPHRARLFERAAAIAREAVRVRHSARRAARGLILVDTKYEMAVDAHGTSS